MADTAAIVAVEELRLDVLTRDRMGSERQGCLEALLAANPGLAGAVLDLGGYVPTGTAIAVPRPPERPAEPTVYPWD